MEQGTPANHAHNEPKSSFVLLGRGEPISKTCAVNEYEMKSKTTFGISIITEFGKM
jgi:hypothetical protein